MQLNDNAFERANLALSNILNPSSAAMAVTNPDRLSPSERKTWVDNLLGGDAGPLKSAVEFATSPWTIAGLVLTMAYKIPRAGLTLSAEAKMAQYAKSVAPTAMWWQDFHSMFEGTPLPRLFEYVIRTNHLWQKSNGEAVAKLVEGFESAAGPLTEKQAARLSAFMDGLHKAEHPVWALLSDKAHMRVRPPTTLTPTKQELEFVDKMRQVFRSQYDTIMELGGQTKESVTHLKRMGVMIDPSRLKEEYFPHVESMTRDQLRKKYEDWVNAIELDGQTQRYINEQAVNKKMSDRLLNRTEKMLPNEEHLQKLGLWDDNIASAYKKADAGHELGGYRRYSLDLIDVASNYTRGMGRVAAWSVPAPGGKRWVGKLISDELKLLGSQNPYKANIVRDSIIPLASGQLSWEQWVPNMNFSQSKAWAGEVLEKLPLPTGLKDVLRKPLIATQSLSYRRVGAMIQTHFYLSTMGLNPVSPMKNLLQSVITTIPMIGPKYFAAGLKDVAKRAEKYRGFRAAGIESEKAFNEAFGEFAETAFDVGRISPLAHLEDPDTVFHPRSKISKAYDWLADKSLRGFTWTERFNRLVAFYGARAKGLDELPGLRYMFPVTGESAVLAKGPLKFKDGTRTLFGQAVQDYADQVARATQFGGGALNTPLKTLNWWGPIRQFTMFPLRVGGFVLGRGVKNPGILGRMLLGSSAAYYGGKAAGLDVSSALMWGALPDIPSEERPFAPAPLISPFLQVVGSTMNAAAKGDLSELSKALPLLVPFGVAGSRAIGMVAPPIARAVRRPYADYSSPTADGKIPVYSPNKTLIGYYSYWQLMGKALGMGDLQGWQEQAMMKYFLVQRDEIRNLKRSYMEALQGNNVTKAEQINNEYKRRYPTVGPGKGITLTKTEIDGMQLRREVPRIEKLLDTLPPDQRESFAKVLAASLGAAGGDFLGVDPATFGTGTSRSRSGSRPYRPGLQPMPSQTMPSGVGEDAVQNARALADYVGGQGIDALLK